MLPSWGRRGSGGCGACLAAGEGAKLYQRLVRIKVLLAVVIGVVVVVEEVLVAVVAVEIVVVEIVVVVVVVVVAVVVVVVAVVVVVVVVVVVEDRLLPRPRGAGMCCRARQVHGAVVLQPVWFSAQ